LLIFWYGVIFGILDCTTNIVYFHSTQFANPTLENACLGFIVLQPLFYAFVFAISMASSPLVESTLERFRMVLVAPVYALLQYLKLLGAFEGVHGFFLERFRVRENVKLVSLENCFKVQVFVEFGLENLPQLIVQGTNNNLTQWTVIARLSFASIVLLFVKDATLVTLYAIRKFIDHASNPELRPKVVGQIFTKAKREASLNLRNYLVDPMDGMDEDGNTTMHQLTKFEDI